MAKKLHHTLADYVTMALSPVLIMALIGSLVFFLVEVLYAGQQFESRLRWTLFWYVFGMVLVARIAVHPAVAPRAPIYGLILAGIGWVAMCRFVSWEALTGGDDPGPVAWLDRLINGGFVLLVWWCASKLVWDCTFIDDSVDASGKGVLEAAGLDETTPATTPDELTARSDKRIPGPFAWFERYRRYRDRQRKKPHTPGVWVVYFSLAALPLFGLGQSLIPPDEVESRRSAFWLLSIYVASGLGLLVTTSFLGLRRYLRQRKLEMPAAMTGVWMGLGAGIILVLLVLGAFLPRPNAEVSLFNLNKAGDLDRDASRFAVLKDGHGKGEGNPSDDGPADKKAEGNAGNKRDKDGDANKKSDAANQDAGQKGKDKQDGGDKQDGSDASKKGQQGNDRAQEKSKRDAGGQDRRQNQANRQVAEQDGRDRTEKPDKGRSDGRKSQPRISSSSSPLPEMGRFGTILKWIVFALVAAVVVFYLFKQGLTWLANFTHWARALLNALKAWWAALFGGSDRQGAAVAEADFESEAPWERPFAEFENPFVTGLASRLTPNQVVRYSFEALQAWAREHDLGRKPQETALEFVARVGEEIPSLEAESRGLAGLFGRVAYARANLKAGSLEPVQRFWQRLEAVTEQPLSA